MRSMQVHPPHLMITRLGSHHGHGPSWSSTRPFILFLSPPHHLGMFARSSLVRPALQAARIGAAAPAMRLAPASSRSVHRVPTTAGAAGTPPASSPVWKLGRLNHVAIAVPDLDKGISFYRDVLGGNCSDTVVGRPTPAYHTSHCVQPHSCAPAQTNPSPKALPDHGVYTVFVDLGNTKIEVPKGWGGGQGLRLPPSSTQPQINHNSCSTRTARTARSPAF